MIHCVLCQNEKHTDPTTGTLHLKSNLTDVYNVMVRVRRVRVRSLLYALYHYDTLPNITPNLNCSIASTPMQESLLSYEVQPLEGEKEVSCRAQPVLVTGLYYSEYVNSTSKYVIFVRSGIVYLLPLLLLFHWVITASHTTRTNMYAMRIQQRKQLYTRHLCFTNSPNC